VTARRAVLAAFLALGALVALAAPASAHATLESSNPAPNAVLDAAPRAVVLRFSESVRAGDDALRVFDANGRRVDEGDLSRPDGDSSLQLALPDIGNGSFVATWRVVSADSHPISGGFTFRVGQDAAAVGNDVVGKLLAQDGGSSTVGLVYGVIRFLAFAALVVLVGGAAFLVVAWPEGARLRGPLMVLAGAAGVLALATALGIGVQGAYERALDLSGAFKPSVITDELGTRFGVVWAARLVLVAATVPLLIALGQGDGRRTWWRVAAGAVGLGLVFTPALSGHASAGDLVPLAVVADGIHVGAVAAWLGGLVLLLAFVLRRRLPDELREVVPRFSTLAQVAVGAIVVTGAFQGWRQVRSLDALTSTTYGRLLLVKTLAFAGLVALGALNRAVVRRRLWAPSPVVGYPVGPGAALSDPDADTVVRLRRAVGIELAVAVVILVITAFLVNTAPAASADSNPFAANLSADEAHIEVTVDPGLAGRNDVHVYLHTGSPSDPIEATAKASLPAQNIGPITIPLEPTGPGHWSAEGVDLLPAGDWQLEVSILLTETNEVRTETTVPIR
jgi:copper transport protein